jgi:hypothetical protein
MAARVPPDKIVGAESSDGARLWPRIAPPGDGDPGLIHKNIHGVARGGQGRHQIRRDRGNAAGLWRPRGEEGKAWHVGLTRS